MFMRAAQYDSNSTHVPFQSLKEGGNRNSKLTDQVEDFTSLFSVENMRRGG